MSVGNPGKHVSIIEIIIGIENGSASVISYFRQRFGDEKRVLGSLRFRGQHDRGPEIVLDLPRRERLVQMRP